ncbi:MAG: SDR family oxidoreductase [Vicinamibacteria bacterium]
MGSEPGRVLVAGATGYVGGRLLAALEGLPDPPVLRCLARRPEDLRDRVAATTEVVAGDCLDRASLDAALAGVDTAFYLVHSMGRGDDFVAQDRTAAQNFAAAAAEAGVRRIVYLGGLGSAADRLSAHLRSRQETGALLAGTGVPVVEFRASVIVGSGSLSFEMVRSLVERLPVMLCPRWVRVLTQPIAIEDVVAYLVAALDLPAGQEGVFEVGGPDVLSYGDLMRELAAQRGLRRWLIPVPVLSPRLSSLWLGLVTPLYARVGRQLIDSLRNTTVVRSDRALETFAVRPRPLRQAIARALASDPDAVTRSRWSDARSSSALHPRAWRTRPGQRRIVDTRTVSVNATAAQAFAPVRRIGGSQGWYWGNALWRLRGFLDLLVGGVGVRRGRAHPERLFVGDAVDWWRVEALVPDRLLRLHAEMRLPGEAWLEFEVSPEGGRTTVRQTAIFEPDGVLGLAYWYALLPLHAPIFRGMLRAIASQATPPAARQVTRTVTQAD